MLEALHEGHREDDILHIDGIGKERSDLFITEPCYTAADSGYKEGKAGVFLGETDEIVHIGFDGEPIILCPQLVLLPFRKGLEILIPSRTEIDVPSPETAYQ